MFHLPYCGSCHINVYWVLNSLVKLRHKCIKGILLMVTLSDDEVALIRAILVALRSIKVRDIDKALVILSNQKLAALGNVPAHNKSYYFFWITYERPEANPAQRVLWQRSRTTQNLVLTRCRSLSPGQAPLSAGVNRSSFCCCWIPIRLTWNWSHSKSSIYLQDYDKC